MTEPTATAQDLARELLARLPDRLAHTEGVARKAEEAAAVFEPDEAADLIAAAWLHDIGYAPWLAGIRMRALDGGWFLQSRQYPERVCQLVAHHSGARFEAREGLPRPVSALGQCWHCERGRERQATTTPDYTAPDIVQS